MKNYCINMSTDYTLLFLQSSTLASERLPLHLQLQRYWQRYATRQQLAKLTARQLQDIGLTPEQVQTEIKTPFWR